MNKNQKKLKKQKGITLIALVITIVVLLVLAGVSISLVVGNNGVLTQASNSVIENRKASAREDVEMAFASAEADYWNEWTKDSNNVKSKAYYQEKIKEYLDKTGEYVSLDDVEGAGTYKVKYKKYGIVYTFMVDSNGRVTVDGDGVAVNTTGGNSSGSGTEEPKEATYTVSYNGNGGTGTGMDDQVFTVGTPNDLSPNSFTRNGYKFLGWSTDPSSTTATYEDSENVSDLRTTDGDTITLYAIWMIVAGGTATGGNKTYSDGNNTAIIPENWTVSGFSDEKTIENGLVIYDLRGATVEWTDTNKTSIQSNYNQFVWVPVNLNSDTEEMPRYNGYQTSAWGIDINDCSEPYESGYSDESSEYINMLNSVKTNGGFYVGRYEASNNNGTAESKKEKDVWNKIKWGDSMSNIGTSGAVYRAQQMYPASASNSSVTSTLIYGAQWDAIMTWIDPNYATDDGCSEDSILVDSSKIGNYGTNRVKTGYRSVNNIYDMSGNVWEWTMEAYINTNKGLIRRTNRGGCCGVTGTTFPISGRGSGTPTTEDYDDVNSGFRVSLYLKKK